MKVTVIVASLTHGGAEKVASLWINGFVSRGYVTSCIIVNGNAPVSYKVSDTVIIKRVNSTGRGLIHNLQQIHQIRCYIKELGSNLIITVLHPLGIFAKIASFGLRVKIINTEHNTFDRPSYAPFTLRQKIEKFWINKLFDKVTIFTKADLDYIGNKLKNTVYLPNPLSIEPAASVPAKRNIVLGVGRMEAWYVKGFDLLIDAWGMICQKYPGWKLQILGGGGQMYRDFLVRRAKDNGSIDSIVFADFTADPVNYYMDSSIFVLSSRYEGFGMVLLEAMSQGCACIACDYKGRQGEILPSNEYGITCPPNSVDSIAESISYMIEHDEYRESVRLNCIKRSEDYSLEKIMDRWDDIINTVFTN